MPSVPSAIAVYAPASALMRDEASTGPWKRSTVYWLVSMREPCGPSGPPARASVPHKSTRPAATSAQAFEDECVTRGRILKSRRAAARDQRGGFIPAKMRTTSATIAIGASTAAATPQPPYGQNVCGGAMP